MAKGCEALFGLFKEELEEMRMLVLEDMSFTRSSILPLRVLMLTHLFLTMVGEATCFFSSVQNYCDRVHANL